MCFDPITLAASFASMGTTLSSALSGTLGTVATIGSGIVGAVSSVQQGNAAAAAARATADQQEKAAMQTLEAAEMEEMRMRRSFMRQQGENRVALAASGVDVGSTAALDLLGDNRSEFEEDAYVIRTNAAREANSYGMAAAASRQEGANAKSRGRWGAASTLLSTATLVGDRHKKYVQQGRYERGIG